MNWKVRFVDYPAQFRKLEPEIETVFLMADEEYSYVSSTLMKQVFMLGGRVAGLIPELVEERMRNKLKTQT